MVQSRFEADNRYLQHLGILGHHVGGRIFQLTFSVTFIRQNKIISITRLRFQYWLGGYTLSPYSTRLIIYVFIISIRWFVVLDMINSDGPLQKLEKNPTHMLLIKSSLGIEILYYFHESERVNISSFWQDGLCVKSHT